MHPLKMAMTLNILLSKCNLFIQAFLYLSIFAQAACLHKNYITSRSVRRVFFQHTHQSHQIKDTETQSIDTSANFYFEMISR